MAIRVRADGTMWCAAHTEPLEGDTYIDDREHYFLSVERGLIVSLPMPEHIENPQWWWKGNAPEGADMSFANDPAGPPKFGDEGD